MISLSLNEFNFKIQSFIPILIEFWEPSCIICSKAEAFMIKLGEAYKGKLQVSKINVSEALVLIDLYSISRVPIFILFRSGIEVTRHIGFRDEMSLEKDIRKFL
jgi:thioredoxin 1